MGAGKVLSQFVATVEVRSSVSPPVVVDVARLGEPGGGPSGIGRLVLKLLRPTVTVSGPLGVQVVAPGGEATRYGGLVGAALVVGVLGAAVGVGMLLARR